MKNPRTYFMVGILSAIFFSISTPLSKLLLDYLNEFLLAGLLYMGGALGLLPVLLKKEQLNFFSKIQIHPKEKKRVVYSVIFGGILGPLLLLFGLQSVEAGSVSILLNMELVATAILGILFFNESLDRNGLIGILCMVLSGVIMTMNEGVSGIIPALFIIGACFMWGVDNHTTGMIQILTPSQVTVIKGLFAGIFNIIIGLVLTYQRYFRSQSINNHALVTPTTILLALLLGMCSYGVSIVFYIISAQQIGSTRAQVLFSSSPIMALLFSVAILNEELKIFHLIAIIFTVFGIFFSNRTSHEHAHQHKFIHHNHEHIHEDGHHDHIHNIKHNDRSKTKTHSHSHVHEKKGHSHPHFPDLHHRHHRNNSK